MLDPAAAAGPVLLIAAAAVGAAGVAAAAAGAADVALAAADLGGWKDQRFVDPAQLAGSGLWRGQRCPWFQLLGPTRLPESVVEMVNVLAGWPRSSGGNAARRTTRSEDA